MARTRTQEEWSCPLCTLLNAPKDDRCAACDNARPPAHQLRNSEPPEASTAVATASDVQLVYRPAPGVFFSSLSRDPSDSSAAALWRQETRLVVNRRRGDRRRKVTTDAENKVGREPAETGTSKHSAGSTATQRTGEQETEAVTQALSSFNTTEKEQLDEDEDNAEMEEPCFNLLGSMFAAPVAEEPVDDHCATNEAKDRDGSDEVDVNDDVDVVPSPRTFPGFMPASKVLAEDAEIEEKLTSAGLDLSESEEEEEDPTQLRRRRAEEEKDGLWEEKWVCQMCTNLNAQTAMECSSCNCNRYRDPPRNATGPAAGSTLRWACHICTNLNPPDATDCLMCLSTRKNVAGPSNGASSERWKCSLCATFNDSSTMHCETCDRSRQTPAKNPTGKGPQCPVCTNINSPGSTRCDLCDSALRTDMAVPEDQFVDLASSPPGLKSSYNFDEDELENPYADLSQYNDYDAPNEAADVDSDYVEEISDNEQPSMAFTNPRPPTVRAELKELEHFVCMEDLRRDYGCRINFSKMFAGQRSGKSYSDRLSKRQAQSRKRKRAGARKEAGGPTSRGSKAARGGKAAKGGKKRKAAAAPRRASAGTAKAPRGKRARKTGPTARRTSSATTYTPGINHYDDSAADFGEDLNTMAWEGVGSAGYL